MEYIETNSERWLSLEDLPNERWKDIEGYEGLYQISDYGRVKSSDRYVCKKHAYKSKIIKTFKDRDGYFRVRLSKNCKIKSFFVHRLVGNAFVDNPENKPIYNHIKPVTKTQCDNRCINLEPATYSENNKYAYILGKKPSLNGLGKFGINNPCSVKVNQYTLDNKYLKTWDSFADITRELGFLHGNIVSCCKGRYKQAYGYIWKYKEKR